MLKKSAKEMPPARLEFGRLEAAQLGSCSCIQCIPCGPNLDLSDNRRGILYGVRKTWHTYLKRTWSEDGSLKRYSEACLSRHAVTTCLLPDFSTGCNMHPFRFRGFPLAFGASYRSCCRTSHLSLGLLQACLVSLARIRPNFER